MAHYVEDSFKGVQYAAAHPPPPFKGTVLWKKNW
jgi:hypothetical protein